jgi:hypothetical protein
MRNPFEPIRDFFRRSAMIGTSPSQRSIWHDPAEHARDFAERYAELMNFHVENRMMELGISTDRIGARKYGYPHRAFWPEETTGGGTAPGRRLTVDSDEFNTELLANRPEARQVWAKSTLRDRIAAIIAHVVLPWHSLGPVSLSEAFALRLHELTGCLIADRRNGRLVEPTALSGTKKVAI